MIKLMKIILSSELSITISTTATTTITTITNNTTSTTSKKCFCKFN